MTIYGLQANHLAEPLGFALESLSLSWKVKDAIGKKQTAAQVIITNAVNGKVLHDSGLREDIDSLSYVPGIVLVPRTRYAWCVRVTTDAGEDETSAWTGFETGKMDEPWQAKWITPDEKHVNTRMFRSFALRSGVKQARLYISGLGLYEAQINGKRVGDEYLAPLCNNYEAWIQAQTYDVTRLVKKENSISVILGDGWYKGRFGFQGQAEVFGKEQVLIAELHVDYRDGSHEVICTDESWQAQESCVRFSNIYDGETVDMTYVPDAPCGVHAADFSTDRLVDRLSPPVKVMHEIKPVAIIHTPKGETVLDLGQEITGFLAFRAKGAKGHAYHMWYGEVLQEDCFYNENLRSAKAEYHYVSDGKKDWVKPHFTFYGFRYVKLEGFGRNPDLNDFVGCVLYSEMETTASLATANDKVNRLALNALWGQRGNFLDVPTDCPQRDERMGWTGDAQAFCATACYQMDSAAFYAKFMHDMLTEQDGHDGAVPHVIPSFGMECSPSCAWADAASIIPWTVYLFYGDKSLLARQYANMTGWADWLYRMDEKTGGKRLWHVGFHFADWLALDAAFPSSCTGGTDRYYIASCFYLYTTWLTAKAAAVLGYADDAAVYARRTEEIRQGIRREYLTASGRLAVNTQTAYILALFLDIVRGDEAKFAREQLDRQFAESHRELRTGFVGTSYMSRVLTHNGMGHLAWSLFLREDYPGWLYEVNMGATTVWERWNSILPDGRISDTGMNSLNHYAYGSVMEWFYRDAAGLAPMECAPGFRRVMMQPHPDARLPEVDFTYESPVGQYRSAWRVTGEKAIEWQITVPFGAEAAIVLPLGKVDGVAMERGDDCMTAVVPAGEYTLRCEFDACPWDVHPMDKPLAVLMEDPDVREAIYAAAPDLDTIFTIQREKRPLERTTVRQMLEHPFTVLPSDQLMRLEDLVRSL